MDHRSSGGDIEGGYMPDNIFETSHSEYKPTLQLAHEHNSDHCYLGYTLGHPVLFRLTKKTSLERSLF